MSRGTDFSSLWWSTRVIHDHFDQIFSQYQQAYSVVPHVLNEPRIFALCVYVNFLLKKILHYQQGARLR